MDTKLGLCASSVISIIDLLFFCAPKTALRRIHFGGLSRLPKSSIAGNELFDGLSALVTGDCPSQVDSRRVRVVLPGVKLK